MAGSQSSRERTSRGRTRSACAAVGAATIALALGGCGDDKKTSSDSASTGLSRAELVKQANAICKPHFEKISAGASKVLAGGKLPNPRAFGKLAQQTIVPQYTAQIAELRALKPGDDTTADYRAWLAESDATLAKVKAMPPLITDAANFKTVNAKADKLGLSMQCHVGPSS